MQDSHSLKFTGKVETEKALENDKNYSIALNGSITNISTSPNGDGTYSHCYSFRPVQCLIHSELGDTIKTTDPRKNSEKLRSFLKYKYDREGVGSHFDTFEKFYDDFFSKVYKNMDLLLNI